MLRFSGATAYPWISPQVGGLRCGGTAIQRKEEFHGSQVNPRKTRPQRNYRTLREVDDCRAQPAYDCRRNSRQEEVTRKAPKALS